jgi:hypothetical protein
MILNFDTGFADTSNANASRIADIVMGIFIVNSKGERIGFRVSRFFNNSCLYMLAALARYQTVTIIGMDGLYG